MGGVSSVAPKPSKWLRLFQGLTLFGVLSPTIYYAFDGEIPIAIVLLLLVLTIFGFISAVLWMYQLNTWRVVFPMLLTFALMPFALFSCAGIANKFELDAVRNKVLEQLGSDSNFTVRSAEYHLTGFDPSASWEIEVPKTLPAPVLGWGPGLIEPDIDFSLLELDEGSYSHTDLGERLAKVPGIADTSSFESMRRIPITPLCAVRPDTAMLS